MKSETKHVWLAVHGYIWILISIAFGGPIVGGLAAGIAAGCFLSAILLSVLSAIGKTKKQKSQIKS